MKGGYSLLFNLKVEMNNEEYIEDQACIDGESGFVEEGEEITEEEFYYGEGMENPTADQAETLSDPEAEQEPVVTNDEFEEGTQEEFSTEVEEAEEVGRSGSRTGRRVFAGGSSIIEGSDPEEQQESQTDDSAYQEQMILLVSSLPTLADIENLETNIEDLKQEIVVLNENLVISSQNQLLAAKNKVAILAAILGAIIIFCALSKF